MKNKVRVGISSCLLGERVRWNGDHKRNQHVQGVLSKYFEYFPICPEVEVGMGTPRESVALYGTLEKPKMVSKKTQTDWTKKMNDYIKGCLNKLTNENLYGYIFKSKSPSCGLTKVPVYAHVGSAKARYGPGLFANAFNKEYPLIPIEDEGRLNDSRIRENFIVRVFSFNRLKTTLIEKNIGPETLVKFHFQHKLLLLAHSRKHYQSLGRMVADLKRNSFKQVLESYVFVFMEALIFKSTFKKNTDVLLHIMGFLRKLLRREEKKAILEAIEDYKQELVPLTVPITLIHKYVKKYRVDYLEDQVYLKPYR